MAVDVSFLYKVLKDAVNQKILVLIKEHGSLSYADLMEKSEMYSEALLNCHLKVMGDLLRENEENKYVLTEKGSLALKMLEEHPEQITKFERKKQKQTGTYIGSGFIIALVISLIVYSQGYIDQEILHRIVMYTIFIAIGLLGYVMRATSLTSESARKKSIIVYKIIGIVSGGMISPTIAMVGILISTIISLHFGGPNFIYITWHNPVFYFSYFIIAIIIGCITGYYMGKKFAKKQLY